ALLGVFSSNIAVGFENVGLIERLDRLAFRDEAADLPNRNQLLRDIPLQGADGAEVALIRILSYTDTVVAFGQATATGLLCEVAAGLAKAGEDRAVYRYAEDVLAILVAPGGGQLGLLARMAEQRFRVASQMMRARFAIGCAPVEAGIEPA